MKSLARLVVAGVLVSVVGGCAQPTVEPTPVATEKDVTVEQEVVTATPAPSAKQGGTVKVAMADLRPLDPHEAISVDQWKITMHLFEGLFGLDEQGRPAPMLASGYELSDEGKTLTLTLREGVKFHNGDILEAADVVASLNRIAVRSSWVAGTWPDVIDNVAALDDRTVQLTLKKPFAPLLTWLAEDYSSILPAEIAEAAMDRSLEVDEVVGTGPYRLVEVVPDHQAVLERFDEYVPDVTSPSGHVGEKVAYIDRLEYVVIPEAATRVAALEAGDVQVADNIPSLEAQRIQAAPGLKTVVGEGLVLAVNLNIHNPPLDDPKIREALTYALDQEEIMLTVAEGESSTIRLDPSWFEEGSIYHSTAGQEYYRRYDPDKAKQLLEEAGYQGEELIFLTSMDKPQYHRGALAATEQFEKVGLNVDLQNMDWAGVREAREDPAKWHLFPHAASFFVDPASLEIVLVCDSGWYANYCDPAVDDLFAQMNAEFDLEKRAQLWDQVERLNWENAWYLIYGHTMRIRGHTDSLQGFRGGKMIVLWNVWLQD